MKKVWKNMEIEELSIGETSNGRAPADHYDDTWVEINDLWYRPGDAQGES